MNTPLISELDVNDWKQYINLRSQLGSQFYKINKEKFHNKYRDIPVSYTHLPLPTKA